MGINPIKLIGNWDEGYALDRHTISSTLVGHDVYGNPQFDTRRSELGELIYQLKNRNKYDNLPLIMELVTPFLSEWQAIKGIRSVIPVPPSTPYRPYQPAFEIAREVAAALGTHYFDNVLEKTTTTKAKDLDGEQKQQIEGSILQAVFAKDKHSMLLVDDLFDSGATLTECVNVLRRDKNIDKIYVLTMTKTKG
jgi:predicted amidophosphoribosyltransferase